MLRLTVLPQLRAAVADEAHFGTVVRAAFSQRRKMLANALSAGLSLPSAHARGILEAAGIDPARRAETLGLEEFVRLAATAPRSGRGGAVPRETGGAGETPEGSRALTPG